MRNSLTMTVALLAGLFWATNTYAQDAEATPGEAPATEAPAEEPVEEASTDTNADDELAAPVEADADNLASTKSFVIAPHIGILAPQLFNELGSWPVFGLELGYILPFDVGNFKRPLQLTLDALYTAPGSTGTGSDPNLGDGGANYEWELQQRMFVLEVNGTWRFMPPGEFMNAYALAGPRVYMMETVLNGNSEGIDFKENRETSTKIGFALGGGLDLAVGPGSLFGTLRFVWSGLDQRITGDTNSAAFVLDLGYRFFL